MQEFATTSPILKKADLNKKQTLLEQDLNTIFAKVTGEAGNSGKTPPNGNAYGWGNGNNGGTNNGGTNNGGTNNGNGNNGGTNTGGTNNGGGNNGTGGSTGGGSTGNGTNVEKFVYYYHPDHLGSSSYITDVNGEVSQHVEYFAFGETFLEEHSNTGATPYLFNGKELDSETGLYYYGARYYDPKTSVWQSVDPLAEKFAGRSPYEYTFSNPINLIDPDGKEPNDIYKLNKNGTLTWIAASDRDIIYSEKNFNTDGILLQNNDGGVDVGEKGYIDRNSQKICLNVARTDSNNKTSSELTTLSFQNNKDKALKVAEYFYKNSEVEFSNSSYKSSNGNDEFSVISTLHLSGSTLIDPKTYMNNFGKDGVYFMPSILYAHDHNHPKNTYPSGYFKSGGHIGINREAFKGTYDYDNTINKSFENVKFRVYTNNEYITYDKNGAK